MDTPSPASPPRRVWEGDHKESEKVSASRPLVLRVSDMRVEGGLRR